MVQDPSILFFFLYLWQKPDDPDEGVKSLL